MHEAELLDVMRGPRESSRVVRLGTVDPNHTSGDPQVQWDGEDAVSTKSYPTVGYTPVAGDRVVAIPAGRSWLIIGKVGSGDLVGHDHDARYVNADGDTMSGPLTMGVSSVRWSTIRQPQIRFPGADTSTERIETLAPNSTTSGVVRVFTNNYAGGDVELRSRNGVALSVLADRSVTVHTDLNVSGTKNAQIADPDDPAKAYRFAAIEADEPGMLAKRWRNVTVDASKQASLPIPEHLIRIGRDPMVMVSAAGPPASKTEPAVGYGWANWDPTDPRVEIRAFAGIYHVLLVFVRADEGANGWTHVVDVPPDPEPDEPQSGL